MTITDRIIQARHDRHARRAARAAMKKLATELAAYSTPAEQMEIDLLAARSAAPGSELVRAMLDQRRALDTVTARGHAG